MPAPNRRVLLPFRHAKKVQPYEEAARAGGTDPVPVHVDDPISLDGMAGLLLMGGSDVNPKLYGEPPRPETDTPDDQRDEVERLLILDALDRDLPILAICRGLQILNVACGGTLIQHLASPVQHDPDLPDKAEAVHTIEIEPATRLAQIADAPQWPVNSRHHQAADRIGTGLRISACASGDRTVEALESPGRRFVVAVQWHPEDQVTRYPGQLQLFRAFADSLA